MKFTLGVCTFVGVVVVGNFVYRVTKASAEAALEHFKDNNSE